MIDYVKFLLEDFNAMPAVMVNARSLFITNKDSSQMIINLILDTELRVYLSLGTTKHKLEKAPVNGKMDVIVLDKAVRGLRGLVPLASLKNIMTGHYNPIWRLAAFFCGYILNADRFYNERNNN